MQSFLLDITKCLTCSSHIHQLSILADFVSKENTTYFNFSLGWCSNLCSKNTDIPRESQQIKYETDERINSEWSR
jgi:hypothetical protein